MTRRILTALLLTVFALETIFDEPTSYKFFAELFLFLPGFLSFFIPFAVKIAG